jgi:hypothetical protein
MWDTVQLREPILYVVREAVDGGSAGGRANYSDGWENGGRWAGGAKRQYFGGTLAGERDLAVVGARVVDDFSAVVF